MHRLGLAGLNNLGRLWAAGMISSYLVLGPGMINVEEFLPPGVLWLMGSSDSGLVSLHIRGELPAEPFASSKNWLALGGAGSAS